MKDASNRFRPTKLGLALVEGYNSMGYKLNLPELRAAIERDCQRVARGEKSKDVVVQSCLEIMRQCFVTCAREAAKLDAAVVKYFPVLGTGREDQYVVLDPSLSTCGLCHDGMELRMERPRAGNAEDGVRNTAAKRFLHCRKCRKSYILPSRGELSQHELSCVICGFQVLNVRNAETNKDHTICPCCYNDPPPPPDGLENAQDFRCFSCARADCALALRTAGGDVAIAKVISVRVPPFGYGK